MNSIFTRRTGYIAAIGTVATIAAWGSYRHMADVATIAGQPIEVASTLPLSVDGMLLVATLAMADDKANGRKPRAWARFAFWLGATISVAANIASTVVHNGPNPLSIGVAAWAPIALLVVTEIMAKPGTPNKDVARSEAAKRGAEKRKANAAKPRTRSRRKPNAAPVSPGAPVTGYVLTDAELQNATA